MKDNDDFNDYFDGPDIPDEVEKPKEPTPEEIEEMKEKEDTIVIPSHKYRNILITIITVLILVLAVWVYMRYCSPYVSNAQKVGYIQQVEKRGYIFKTYEGDMITEFAIHDTSKVYQRDFVFSIDNDSLAKVAMGLQGTGKKVTLTYKEYGGVLPWRGGSKCILTSID